MESAAHSEAHRPAASAVIGASTTGVTSRLPAIKPGEPYGHFAAINPLTGKPKWEIPLMDLPSSAGMLATGGGVVFTGETDRRVRRAR